MLGLWTLSILNCIILYGMSIVFVHLIVVDVDPIFVLRISIVWILILLVDY